MVKVFIIIFMMFSIFLDGQNNLLQNGDFEKIVQCPQNHTKYLSTDTNKILFKHLCKGYTSIYPIDDFYTGLSDSLILKIRSVVETEAIDRKTDVFCWKRKAVRFPRNSVHVEDEN